MGAQRAARLATRIGTAADAFSEERFVDARRILTPIATEAPGATPARELLGLTLYRLGKWRAAAKELEAFRQLTGSTEQNPVLADCYRAMKKYPEVDELWEELREASPSAELVNEGRIVAAGSLADRQRLPEAIALLERGWKIPARPRPYHLRRAYALADLHERAGDLPRARLLFGWVVGIDPDFADAAERTATIG